jgi:hypothetical protein
MFKYIYYMSEDVRLYVGYMFKFIREFIAKHEDKKVQLLSDH